MPETLTDILAAALCPPHPWGGHGVGCRLHDVNGEPVYWDHEDQARSIIERIPAPEREAMETGLSLLRASATHGFDRIEWMAGDEVWEACGWADNGVYRRTTDRSPLAALTSLLAQLDPTR